MSSLLLSKTVHTIYEVVSDDLQLMVEVPKVLHAHTYNSTSKIKPILGSSLSPSLSPSPPHINHLLHSGSYET